MRKTSAGTSGSTIQSQPIHGFFDFWPIGVETAVIIQYCNSMFDFDVERDFRRPLTSHLVRTVRFTEYAIENSVENSYTPSMRPHPSQPEDNERGVAKCLAPMAA